MLGYIARRILATIPVMGIVALFVFSLLYIAPGDPAAVIAGDQATPADVERIRQNLGLDRPFLVRFGEWFWHILQGDMGKSIFTALPVWTMIEQRIGPTVSLMIVTLLLAVTLAVPMGVLAAWKAGSWIDRIIMGFAVFGFSVPVFVVAYLLAYVFALQLEWLPVQGYTPLSQGFWPWLENLILPSIALGCVYIALIARITRATMLEVLSQDYIKTARATASSDSRATIPLSRRVGHWSSSCCSWPCSRLISARSTRPRSRPASARGRPRRSSGSAATCSGATSTRASSTARGCR